MDVPLSSGADQEKKTSDKNDPPAGCLLSVAVCMLTNGLGIHPAYSLAAESAVEGPVPNLAKSLRVQVSDSLSGALQVITAGRKSLFQGFPIAGVLGSVKANFVPILGDMKAGTTPVQHRGGHDPGQRAGIWSCCALSW